MNQKKGAAQNKLLEKVWQKNKKGAAHFEMIIAFIFFVGFVFFVFSILKPYDEQKVSYAVIEGVKDSLSQEVRTNFTKFFVMAEWNSSCLYLNLSKDYFRYELNNSKVFDIDMNEIDSNFIGNQLHLSKNQTYYYVHFSPDFTEETFNCYPNMTNYTIGGFEEMEILSLKKLELMESEYYSNYLSVKNKLGIPKIYDFSISLDEVSILMEANVPQTGEIIARDYLVSVLNYTSGKVINSRMNIRVW